MSTVAREETWSVHRRSLRSPHRLRGRGSRARDGQLFAPRDGNRQARNRPRRGRLLEGVRTRQLDYFLRHGLWGMGDRESNSHRLAGQMRGLLVDDQKAGRARRLWPGNGRGTVLAGAREPLQLGIYDAVVAARSPRRWSEAAACRGSCTAARDQQPRPAPKAGAQRLRDQQARCRAYPSHGRTHRACGDHIRAVMPALLGQRPSPTRSAGVEPWDGLVVLCAAKNWDEVKLADRHMAEHLSALAPVLYVDPPISHLTRFNAPAVAGSLKRPRLRESRPGSPATRQLSLRSRWSRRSSR